MSNRETAAAFARRCGMNRSTISRAIKAGRLILGDDGLLDVDQNLERWQQTKTGTRSDVADRHRQQRSAAAQDAAGDEDDPDIDMPRENAATGADANLAGHTRDLLSAQNAMARLALQLRMNRRYPLARIVAEAQAIGAILRAALERMVDQTAPRLAVLSDEGKRSAIIGAECDAVWRLVRRELPRAMRRMIAEQGEKKP
jgi:hypothetical protein